MLLIILFHLMILFLILSIIELRAEITLKQRIDKLVSEYAINNHSFQHFKNNNEHRFVKMAKVILNKMNLLKDENAISLGQRLTQAGLLHKNALVIFLASQLISMFSFISFSFLLVLVIEPIASYSFLIKGIIVVALMYIGYKAPEWYLNHRTKQYRILLRRSILEFFELFLICIESGFGTDKALNHVSSELKFLHPALFQQIEILIKELNLLSNRTIAWDHFAARTGIEEVKIITQIIKQSEQLGTSMSQALRSQLDLFQAERLTLVEQKAMRLPTLLTLPLVLFIFPTLLLVILGPAILKAMDIFSG